MDWVIDWNLWRRYSGIPETFSIASRSGVTLGYPLRPGELSCVVLL